MTIECLKRSVYEFPERGIGVVVRLVTTQVVEDDAEQFRHAAVHLVQQRADNAIDLCLARNLLKFKIWRSRSTTAGSNAA